jgi:inhibitor of cysteine peptidase
MINRERINYILIVLSQFLGTVCMLNFIRPLVILILFSLFIVSCKQTSPTTSPTTMHFPSVEEKAGKNEASVEHINVKVLESFPVQVNVAVRGSLPDDCTNIDDIIEDRSGNTFMVKILTTHQKDKPCTQGIKPFQEIISLNVDGISAGIYTVKVNNVSESFELGVDNNRID